MSGHALARWRPTRSYALTLALLLGLLPLLWLGLADAPPLRVDVGVWGDHAFIDGINSPEENPTETYRWTKGESTITLPAMGTGPSLLRVRMHGWRPPGEVAPQLQISVPGHEPAWGQMVAQQRVYNLLLPPAQGLDLAVALRSEIYQPPNDRRDIGVALDWLELRPLEGGAPSLWQFGGQALLAGLLAGLFLLTLPRPMAPPLTATVGAAMLWANAAQPLWVSSALAGWLLVTAGLLLGTWLAAPHWRNLLVPWMIPRQADRAWALLVAGLLLRLLGAVHPLFDTHDLPYHTGWLELIGHGELVFYSTPGEFKNQVTFNPPAGYLLLLPFSLGLSPRLAVQVGVGLIDGLGCLLLLPLARELGMSARAALLALALYIALPINTTMLWWGFATNTLAQTIGMALFWLLLRLLRQPDRTTLVLCAAVAAAALLTHVGALVLEVGLLGLFLLLSWRGLPRERRALLGLLAGLVVLAVGLVYFSLAAAPVLASQGGDGQRTLAETLRHSWNELGPRLNLMRRGAVLGFLPPLLLIAPLGLGRLVRSLRGAPRALVIAWVTTCLVFMGVYLVLGTMARYYYFVTPLLCLACAAVLVPLWSRRTGRLLLAALVVLVLWNGGSLWFQGVLMREKPSLTPLTH
ncbi:MAG TPA: glycosyltransferase family 39 protein [Roseiflexaceae bacterium]|nr:glycosyltransferase family 39 protein [Roseiflexaceae bacterium]